MPKVANMRENGSKFIDRVHEVVARIPFGRVTTYGAIARSLGEARAARMVGWAVNSPPPELNLPCHRVVNRIGFLSGGWHFGHPDVMRDALLAEGITFVAEYQVDLSRYFWDPSLESAATDEMDDLKDISGFEKRSGEF
ncbi:MAG TPA: MGMT family protein [Thermomicrobiales bacterium]|nr:MGMT family protein [Thermomicrobiales bacterium]